MRQGQPSRAHYDVVVVGGAMMGTSAAFHLLRAAPGLRVLVVEPDPSYANAATSHTNSCIRQQFSCMINVEVSRYAAEVIRDFAAATGDPAAPAIALRAFGYLYLATTEGGADVLRANRAVQGACGAATRLMTPDAIAAAWPFYDLGDVVLGSHGPVDEGYFDGAAMFAHWRALARRRGAETVTDRVVALRRSRGAVSHAVLGRGAVVGCGHVVNAAGTRAAAVAALAGIALPVAARKRTTYVFAAERPLDRPLPLTIDPCGIHVRSDGAWYMAGAAPEDDQPVDPGDFTEDHAMWEARVWPALAARIPAFDAVRLRRSWVGHYDWNAFDRNAILGPHPEVTNFHFMNGFSGHGLQQAPAMGRGLAERIVHGGYRTLDLSPYGFDRIALNRPLTEHAII